MLAASGLAFLLPSALLIPTTGPGSLAEFEPGDDDAAAGNISELGAGSSSGLGFGPNRRAQRIGAGPAFGDLPGQTPKSSKRCVGLPPRQTEDPLSPPCVAFFDGDNFGATHRGVTADEIKILFHLPGGLFQTGTSRGGEQLPADDYYDLAEPPRDDDPPHVRGLRVLMHYFNFRYQTYGRSARFIVYYNSGDPRPAVLRAAAADNLRVADPFAVLAYTPFGGEEAYLDEMMREGVLSFGSLAARTAAFYRRHAPKAWGYLPSVEVQAEQFSAAVCTQVVRHDVTFSGNSSERGQPRRLGLISTEDPMQPGMRLFADLVKQRVEACGGEFVAHATTPVAGRQDATVPPDYAARNMADFQRQRVSTIIWAQGSESHQSKAAAQISYLPEWVLAGDLLFEGFDEGQLQDQRAWRHAMVVTKVVRTLRFAETLCAQAFKETQPDFPLEDASLVCRQLPAYNDLRQVFTGIQVAGPRLTPATMDSGFHAIPAVRSTDTRVPACFYDRNDYTCVKDSARMWWHTTGEAPNSRSPGCWRLIEAGRRYLRGDWMREDIAARKQADDPCNGYARNSVTAE